MRYRMLDSNGDYTFGASLLNFYIDTPAAVGQAVMTGLLLWLGEWYQDITLGVPYLEGIIGKYAQTTADANIQAQIVNFPGVEDISSFVSTLDPNTRGYSFTATIDTIYGPTEIQLKNYVIY